MIPTEVENLSRNHTETQPVRFLEKVAHGFENVAFICGVFCILCAFRALIARIHYESSNAGWISLGFLAAAFLSVIVAQLMFIRLALESRCTNEGTSE